MDAIWNAFVAAVVDWMPQLVGGAASLLIVWMGKAKLLKSQARTAALEAEKELPGTGLGAKRKVIANNKLKQTMSGLVTTQANRASAIQDHGMKAVEDKKKNDSEKPPRP